MKTDASPVELLARAKTIAVVGASRNPEKEANSVPRYLKERGYRIVPVNPSADEILGEKSYPSLLDLPQELGRAVDVVEVFRPSESLPEVARQVVEMKGRYGKVPVFWAQQGLDSEEARRILEAAGVKYVMDACMRTIHQIYVRKAA
ncbi:MAG: CoA-binding protein [Nitrososphaerota archaeon]|jgi:predicted CoA-binding protein|nr:CoA-binding protein [Nitrososphaerota archaeon]MDG6966134.1 CoA-binding protein [Nitrososphaerota archaeon]MDG6968461.1 CoA-binding protein [Nitrososphaerota archaeon]MDG6977569.1 CoA-binding protein [Nitrososphaerota archaeon]MDG7020807.1 CoA-binding protein [Nitrososphaerota archaeon]